MNGLSESVNQIKTLVGSLSPRGKLLAGVALLSALLGLGGVVTYSRSVDYAVLYSGIGQDEMAKVLDELQAKNVPYQLSRGGSSVSVPWDQVPELRLDLAAGGALRGASVGLELFERGTFGQSEFAEQVTFTRALQGELARTISGLEPVERAVVHVGRPRKSVFVGQGEAASASVVLRLHPGRTLSARQIAGIRALVSASVEGLDAGGVSVLDDSGAVLANAGAEDGAQPATSQTMDAERATEDYLTRKAQSLLDTAFGPRRAVVRVSARLTRESFEERSEKPEKGVPISEQISTKTSVSGSGATPSGVGASANDPNHPGGGGGQAEKSVEEQETTQYAVGKRTRVVKREAGQVERLTVGLMLDEALAESATQIEAIVKEAVGFDAERGDTVEVTALPFQDVMPVEEPGALETLGDPRLERLVGRGLLAVALIVAALLGFSALRKLPKLPTTPAQPTEPGVVADRSQRAAEPEAQQDPREFAVKRVSQDPELAGRIIEFWLGETQSAGGRA